MNLSEKLALSLTDRMELAIYHTECTDTVNLFWQAIGEIERLREDNAKLRTALEHYASADNWLGLPGTGVQRVWLEPDSSTRDAYHGYEIARAALGCEND